MNKTVCSRMHGGTQYPKNKPIDGHLLHVSFGDCCSMERKLNALELTKVITCNEGTLERAGEMRVRPQQSISLRHPMYKSVYEIVYSTLFSVVLSPNWKKPISVEIPLSPILLWYQFNLPRNVGIEILQTGNVFFK
ncbi:uncharacterized protein [Fopius arisanus]|uniref:Uncharacterized protein n=1 Tax=Fopius arisanus TaxID=64838 RepID=A0A9R1TDR5_9HYME|nr:PREDICTED: uncharacterized protein LOC105269314 [Fopius arisanus]